MLTHSPPSDLAPDASFESPAWAWPQASRSFDGIARPDLGMRRGDPAHGSEGGRPARRAQHAVEVLGPAIVTRQAVIAKGMTADIAEVTSQDPFELRFLAPVHLLVVHEQGIRRDGDTFVEGLPRSSLRDLGRTLTFVPAGHEYREWQQPKTRGRLMFVYFDPAELRVLLEAGMQAGVADASFAARLFFQDATLLATALKLKQALESPSPENRLYIEALGVVLVHELIRLNRETPHGRPRFRGGLAAWQQRVVKAHIDAHVGAAISLAELARLARLSTYHFCRAFKQSFGVPPHRYHMLRRIERAKELLARRTQSVTEIALTVGYGETSSFTAAFRKATGLTPSAYRRSLG